MAGDWIKMRVDLTDDPAVIGIAGATGLDEFAVVGRLHRIWAWADSHTTDGNAASVSGALALSWIDRYVSADGFAQAMMSVGWLVIDDSGVHFPKFDRHNGKTGKQRALTARRVAKHTTRTNADANGGGVSEALGPALPREEKRRDTDPPNGGSVAQTEKRRKRFTKPTVEEVAAYCRERKNGIDAQRFIDHYEAKGWIVGKTPMKDWKAAVRTWEQNGLSQSSQKGEHKARLPTPEELANWNPYNGGLTNE